MACCDSDTMKNEEDELECYAACQEVSHSPRREVLPSEAARGFAEGTSERKGRPLSWSSKSQDEVLEMPNGGVNSLWLRKERCGALAAMIQVRRTSSMDSKDF